MNRHSPAYGLSAVLVTLGDDFYFVRDHKSRVEAQSEMSDDGIGLVLILFQEVGDTRESDLVDVFVNLLSRHADTAVADG